MSDHDQHSSPSTLQPMIIIFGIILAIAVVVSMVLAKPAGEEPVPVVANVEANIKPVAAVEVAAPVTEHVAKSGAEEIGRAHV